MDYILDTLRKIKDINTRDLFTGAFGLLLLIILIAGYFIFFFNPGYVLDIIRFPIFFIYIILVFFILFFLFRRFKQEPIFNLGFEMKTHIFTFAKVILFFISVFIAFYICYNLLLTILLASINISIFLTIIILIIVLAIINSYTKMYETDVPNELLDFIKDLIFYIPCLITDFIDFAKKDYTNTPSTVFILFIILVIICLIYLSIFLSKNNSSLLLIDTPAYLNTSIITLNKIELTGRIIQSRPWYERELLKLQNNQPGTTMDICYNQVDFNWNEIENINWSTEGFTSVISHELKPIHLNITDYDRYILKQAMYSDPNIINQMNVSTNPHEIIKQIIAYQKGLITIYEWILIYLATWNSNDLSKSILGDLYGNVYHYGISFWLYLNSNEMSGKDIIFQYGTRPSIYYDHSTKALSVELPDPSYNISNNIVLYSSTNPLYQRWNHIIMNYNYGTFDLFINNNLVGTYSNIIQYTSNQELLQVGFTTNNDIGGITQMIYSEEPFQMNDINKIYSNPPKI